jgi:hypothetical protein
MVKMYWEDTGLLRIERGRMLSAGFAAFRSFSVKEGERDRAGRRTAQSLSVHSGTIRGPWTERAN